MSTPFRIKHLETFFLFKLMQVQEGPFQTVPPPLYDRPYEESRID